MANVDLLRLIDLSLGKEPCGVVNFNYMHSLMHEIVRRLGHIEEMNGGDLKAVAMGELKSKAFGSPEKLLDKLDEEVHEPGVPAKVEPSSVQAVPQDVKEAVGDDTESTESLLTHSTPAVSLAKRSSRVLRPRTSIITAANDLGALERKLSTLETRMDAVESLSELLDKRASNSSATPVNDMWNFIQINKRLDATEQGLQKVCSVHMNMHQQSCMDGHERFHYRCTRMYFLWINSKLHPTFPYKYSEIHTYKCMWEYVRIYVCMYRYILHAFT